MRTVKGGRGANKPTTTANTSPPLTATTSDDCTPVRLLLLQSLAFLAGLLFSNLHLQRRLQRLPLLRLDSRFLDNTTDHNSNSSDSKDYRPLASTDDRVTTTAPTVTLEAATCVMRLQVTYVGFVDGHGVGVVSEALLSCTSRQ